MFSKPARTGKAGNRRAVRSGSIKKVDNESTWSNPVKSDEPVGLIRTELTLVLNFFTFASLPPLKRGLERRWCFEGLGLEREREIRWCLEGLDLEREREAGV